MKRFHFSLRPIAILRAHRESQAKEQFGVAVQGYAQAADRLTMARERLANFENTLRSGRAGRFNAAAETHRVVAHRREWAAAAEADKARTVAQSLMDQRRADYIEAHRRLEVVRRLEQKAREAHRLATTREEQAAFDEFATRKAAQQAGKGGTGAH